MNIHIRSAGTISPQHSLDIELFFRSRNLTTETFYKSVEPDYDFFVDSKMIRRMSRIVKMGVASAMTCLRNAGLEQPAAILTATAYGCLEDSSSFLRRMIEFDEKMLSPTAFIQSTHNTVGAQIALLLKCHEYNNTIVHRSFSFENALMEASLLIGENKKPVLVGAVDEITNDLHRIMSRFGLYKQTHKDSKTISGNIAGEGTAFFLLDGDPGSGSLAVLRDVQTLFNPGDTKELADSIRAFLKRNNVSMDQMDLVLTSHTGNEMQDETDDELLRSVFVNNPCFPFKSLCGDYPTASGFALWFAAVLLKEKRIPAWMTGIKGPLQHILIHQHSGEKHHSFFLISAL